MPASCKRGPRCTSLPAGPATFGRNSPPRDPVARRGRPRRRRVRRPRRRRRPRPSAPGRSVREYRSAREPGGACRRRRRTPCRLRGRAEETLLCHHVVPGPAAGQSAPHRRWPRTRPPPARPGRARNRGRARPRPAPQHATARAPTPGGVGDSHPELRSFRCPSRHHMRSGRGQPQSVSNVSGG